MQNVAAVVACVLLASIVVLAFRKFFTSMSQGTVVRAPIIDAKFDHDHEKCIERERLYARNALAGSALNGLLACPPGPNDQAKDRSPEALAELAILYANELVSLHDMPVRSSAEVRREAWAFRNEMMKACGGQVLTQSQLEMLEALEPDARALKCAELAAQWEFDRITLRETIAKENEEIAARVKRNAEALERAKAIRKKNRESEARPG